MKAICTKVPNWLNFQKKIEFKVGGIYDVEYKYYHYYRINGTLLYNKSQFDECFQNVLKFRNDKIDKILE